MQLQRVVGIWSMGPSPSGTILTGIQRFTGGFLLTNNLWPGILRVRISNDTGLQHCPAMLFALTAINCIFAETRNGLFHAFFLKMRKIYFAGSIRGGREDHALYQSIIRCLRNYGEVLTEHVGHEGLTASGEANMTDAAIYRRDMDWLKSSDIVVAEVSTPSLGVGFEIAGAAGLHKPVLCLYRAKDDRRLSAMISGCPDIRVAEYSMPGGFHEIIDDFFRETDLQQ